MTRSARGRARRLRSVAAVGLVALGTWLAAGCRTAPEEAVPVPAPPNDVATATPPATATATAPVGVDTTVTHRDASGRFSLRYGELWREVDAPPSDGAVDWRLRLERGQPDRPLVAGARRPPNGVRLDVGVAEVPPGIDLDRWAATALAVDPEAFSVTADGLALPVGPDNLRAAVREGQILPYYGRWRDWLVRRPDEPERVYVLRAAAYGADQQLGMFHAKVVVATFRPDGQDAAVGTREP